MARTEVHRGSVASVVTPESDGQTVVHSGSVASAVTPFLLVLCVGLIAVHSGSEEP